jgi:hypothetical protein
MWLDETQRLAPRQKPAYLEMPDRVLGNDMHLQGCFAFPALETAGCYWYWVAPLTGSGAFGRPAAHFRVFAVFDPPVPDPTVHVIKKRHLLVCKIALHYLSVPFSIGNPLAIQSFRKFVGRYKALTSLNPHSWMARNAGRMLGQSFHGQHPQ